MAKRIETPIPPRDCAPDLPGELDDVSFVNPRDDLFAARLVHLAGEVDASHGRLVECAVDAASLDRLLLDGTTLADVRVSDLRTAVLSARDGRWRNVLIAGGRLGTLDLSRTDLDGVELRGLRIGYLSLASARVRDVRFVDCVLGTVDVPEARVERVAFDGCRANEVDTRGLRATDVDLRGLEALSFTDPAGLRGATLSERQAQQHAPAFASALSIFLKS
ncbi:MAG: hypothetical protein QM677_08865 [Microbacterium sp.]